MPYRVEISPNKRAGCRSTECKKENIKIDKDEIRFGTYVTIHEHGSWQWRHWGCVTPAVLKNLSESVEGESLSDSLDGYDELPADAQAKIAKALEDGHVADDDYRGDDVSLNRPGVTKKRATKKKAATAVSKDDESDEEEDEEDEEDAEKSVKKKKEKTAATATVGKKGATAVKVKVKVNAKGDTKADVEVDETPKKRTRAARTRAAKKADTDTDGDGGGDGGDASDDDEQPKAATKKQTRKTKTSTSPVKKRTKADTTAAAAATTTKSTPSKTTLSKASPFKAATRAVIEDLDTELKIKPTRKRKPAVTDPEDGVVEHDVDVNERRGRKKRATRAA